MGLEDRIFVGVAHLRIRVPGARSRKDRRQVVASVRDRLRSRFSVTVNEIGTSADPVYQRIVLTTAGNDGKVVRTLLDQCVGMVHSHPVAEASQVDIDVFRWEASQEDWATRMMNELREPDDDG